VALDQLDEPFHPSATPDARRLSAFADAYSAIVANIEEVIRGKSEAAGLAVTCLLAEGHLLIEDVPGVGKTSLAKALAASVQCSWKRIQFTPDLLPSDVVGVSIWNRTADTFDFRPGSIFANLVLADEINRASPKTQSALLEAMEEYQVSVDGTTHVLPRPFMVMATQNPVEHEGVYPLPESQLDRFTMRVGMGYPNRSATLEMLDRQGSLTSAGTVPGASTDGRLAGIGAVCTGRDIEAMVDIARGVHVAPSLKGYLVDVLEASRLHPSVRLGLSPRSGLALLRAARARAAANGRHYVWPDDVKALAEPVLAHRLLLRHEATAAGLRQGDVLADIVAHIPVPVVSAER